MKIFWETRCWPGASIEPAKISCLTWMSHASTTNSTSNQQQHGTVSFIGNAPSNTRGLLAVGTETGVIGITVTDTADGNTFEQEDLSRRYNFNLRGHHTKIQICSWNSSMTKLASCDENGIIYVWVPNDERWSVELVNDRGMKVRDFNWSNNGSAALILYEDNFVLIGSANGQRIWANNFPQSQQVNCGAWAPNSKELVLGLDNGQIHIYNDQGTVITDRQLLPVPIHRVAFSPVESNWTLAVVSSRNQILFLNCAYEVGLRTWQSSDPIQMIQWSSNGQMLAVVCKKGRIIILNTEGRLLHSFIPPLHITEESNVCFTWAHNDEVVIVAVNGSFAVGRVQPGVPSLNDLISYQLWLRLGRTARDVYKLEIPDRVQQQVRKFDRHVIRCRVPSYDRMCRFVCEPTFWRWYCTIIPIPRKNFHYMLCLEHLGGLIPILLGRQTNRVIPQFIISLPPSSAFSTPGYNCGDEISGTVNHQVGQRWDFASNSNPNLRVHNPAFTSDLEPIPPPSIDEPQDGGYSSTVGTEFTTNTEEELALSHNLAQSRNTVWRRSKRRIKKFVSKRLTPRSSKTSRVLCHVKSNVWCTRFKITSPGIKDLPATLANVVYKTSVLHLQPRQMTITLCDLRPLTKTLLDPTAIGKFGQTNNCLQLPQSTHRRHRSIDSSPVEARGNTVEEIEDDDFIANNNEQVGQGIVSPVPVQQYQINQMMQQRYMTYAETRARLRELRPIQRVPVSQQQQGQNAAAQTGRRQRRSGLRFLRRAAEDQQQLIGEPQQLAAGRRQAPQAPPPAEYMAPNQQVEDTQDPFGNHQQGFQQSFIPATQQPRGRHVRFHPSRGEDENSVADSSNYEIMEEEKRLYCLVKSEFDGLCAAVGDKVAKMRSIANELDELQQSSSASSTVPAKSSTSQRRAQFATHRSATTADFTATLQGDTLWQHRVESLDFIDDDAPLTAEKFTFGSALVLSTSDNQPLIPPKRKRTSSSSTNKTNSKLVDRLTALAADIHIMSGNKREDAEPLLAGEIENGEEINSREDTAGLPTSVEKMREFLRDVARKTAQIEETLNTNEIHGDLKIRIQRLKGILGESVHSADLIKPSRAFRSTTSDRLDAIPSIEELADDSVEVQSERGPSPVDSGTAHVYPYDVLRMSNKTPFWNDESQVYQLDFGGRVTQESAKNFQIEHEEADGHQEQVMQFGRIENGAYTLDFCSPLSAVQSFGIALASITQRLK